MYTNFVKDLVDSYLEKSSFDELISDLEKRVDYYDAEIKKHSASDSIFATLEVHSSENAKKETLEIIKQAKAYYSTLN